MNHFLSIPSVRHIADNIQGARLTTSLKYAGHGFNIVIDPMFYTDGGSIPWALQFLVKPWGKYWKEFVVHDYMYFTGSYSREECDTLLYNMLLDTGCNRILLYIIYYSIRAFGGIAWKRHRS